MAYFTVQVSSFALTLLMFAIQILASAEFIQLILTRISGFEHVNIKNYASIISWLFMHYNAYLFENAKNVLMRITGIFHDTFLL